MVPTVKLELSIHCRSIYDKYKFSKKTIGSHVLIGFVFLIMSFDILMFYESYTQLNSLELMSNVPKSKVINNIKSFHLVYSLTIRLLEIDKIIHKKIMLRTEKSKRYEGIF